MGGRQKQTAKKDQAPLDPNAETSESFRDKMSEHVDSFIQKQTDLADELRPAGKMLPDFLAHIKPAFLNQLRHVEPTQLKTTGGLGQCMFGLLKAAKQRLDRGTKKFEQPEVEHTPRPRSEKTLSERSDGQKPTPKFSKSTDEQIEEAGSNTKQPEHKPAIKPEPEMKAESTEKPQKTIPPPTGKFGRWREDFDEALHYIGETEILGVQVKIRGRRKTLVIDLGLGTD